MAEEWWKADPVADQPTAEKWWEADPVERSEPAKQSTAEGALDAFTQGAAFGFGDELTAIEAAVLGKTPEGEWLNYDEPFYKRYRTALEAERAQQKQFETDSPVTATAAEITGAVLSPAAKVAAPVRAFGPAASTVGAVGRGAAGGAVAGGVYGAGEAEGGAARIAEGAVEGAATGAMVGGFFGGALDRLTRGSQRKAAEKAAPSIELLEKAGSTAYRAARARNPALPGFNEFAGTARRTLSDEGFHPKLHPKIETALKEVSRLAKRTSAPDFRSVEKLRRIIGSAGKSLEPDERRLSRMLRDGLDKFVEVSSPMPEVKIGREIWQRMKKAELVDDLVEMARNRAASTGSGGNANNAIRQNLTRILNDGRKRRQFNADEIKAIQAIVDGSPVENALRLVGKMSPAGNGLMVALNLGAAAYNPMMAIPGAVGVAAKAAADRGVRRNVEALSARVRSAGRSAADVPGLTVDRLQQIGSASGAIGAQRPLDVVGN